MNSIDKPQLANELNAHITLLDEYKKRLDAREKETYDEGGDLCDVIGLVEHALKTLRDAKELVDVPLVVDNKVNRHFLEYLMAKYDCFAPIDAIMQCISGERTNEREFHDEQYMAERLETWSDMIIDKEDES